MQKHNTSRICKLSEITYDMLTFELTDEQKKRIPAGEKITFRRSTRPYKKKGYKHFEARAEFNKLNPATGKKHAAAAAAKLLGIVWDDDPEWLYQTDKTKSSIAERRTKACAESLKPSRLIAQTMLTVFEELIDYEEEAVIVRKVPISLFLTVALVGSMRGTTDATSIANFWNNSLPRLKMLFPEIELHEISHDSVNRIYSSLKESAVKDMLTLGYEWVQPFLKEVFDKERQDRKGDEREASEVKSINKPLEQDNQKAQDEERSNSSTNDKKTGNNIGRAIDENEATLQVNCDSTYENEQKLNLAEAEIEDFENKNSSKSTTSTFVEAHFAIDGQVNRSSLNHETDRRMMMLNAVNVTDGKICAAHTQ